MIANDECRKHIDGGKREGATRNEERQAAVARHFIDGISSSSHRHSRQETNYAHRAHRRFFLSLKH